MRVGPLSDEMPKTLNADGQWVTDIPLPLMLWPSRYICGCGRRHWSMETYRGHYALRHILKI